MRDEDRSIVDRIAETSGVAPRVTLGDTAPGGGPGRYQILGEIARGGVGVVLKGRDVDLGREVAVKVIRPEYAGNREILHRFVEEAQVGGQLQHPGIVPVYELGVDEEHRAFFTMKLVQGETLASLLRARKDPAEDLPRFLDIYQQVCNTVAYAHARGVVHRDLKPSNVMVGAFGEVQVVDWGFAKILAFGGVADEQPPMRTVRTEREGSASEMGAVMGTPAYMPREQALGQVDRVDRRSDAFALGAILCEILTGKPPYAEGADAFPRAALGDVADAYAALERCGADPQLVELTKACLAPARDDRPADAGEVVLALSNYVSSVEERARRAEIEAAEARVRVATERRARRLTLALATAVLLAVAVGGISYGWAEKRRQDRVSALANAADDALEQARNLRRRALADPLVNLAEWDAAVEAVEHARELAGDATPASREAIGLLAARLAEEAPLARRNAALVADLDEIRLRRGDVDPKETEGAYAEAFATILDSGSEERGAERMRGTTIADRLVPALDDWIWVRGRLEMPRESLGRIANAVDSDASRVRLRNAALREDREEILRIANAIDASASGGTTPHLVALYLSHPETREQAIAILRAAQQERPADFWLNYQLAYEFTQSHQWPEAASFFGAALASRPGSAETRYRLGLTYQKLGRTDDALDMWRSAIERQPDYLLPYEQALDVYEERQQLDEVVKAAREIASRSPMEPGPHTRLGHALLLQGDWAGAKAAYEQARALRPGESRYLTFIGDTFLYQQEIGEAEAYYRRAITEDPNAHHAYDALARVHAIRFEWTEAFAAYKKAIELDPTNPYYRTALGMALVSAADDRLERKQALLDEGREVLEETVRRFPDYGPPNATLGHLYELSGDYDASIAAYERMMKLEPHLLERRFQTALQPQWDPATGRVVKRRAVIGFKGNFASQRTHRIAQLCYRKGDWKRAIEETHRTLELNPRHPAAHGLLADLLHRTGNYAEALPEARKMIEINPQWAMYSYYTTGFCLLGLGRYEEALDDLAKYYEMSPWPEGWVYPKEAWASECRRYVELHRDLAAILDGRRVLETARDKLVFARLCAGLALCHAASRFFDEAFAMDPTLALEVAPAAQPGFQCSEAAFAACQAAGALCVDGITLTEAERARLRHKAHEWLRTALEEWRRRMPGDRGFAAQGIEVWIRSDPHDVVWAKTKVQHLPEEEQRMWQTFWADVDAFLEDARGP